MIYNEKRAKELLKKEGFEVLSSFYISDISKIKKIIKSLKFPLAVKISGKKIIHKNRVNGVVLDLNSYEEVLNAFKKMKKIKNFEGIVIQKYVQGKEIFLGIKNTPEFGHVVSIGSGGIDVEEIKDVNFRISPLNKEDAEEMLKEVKISKNLNKEEKNLVLKNLLKLNFLIKKYPKISELDINPLIVNDNFCKIIDSKIIFEK
jgi:succinyl-CoA synthetase beta subunit